MSKEYSMNPIDDANRAAEFVTRELMHIHRGVIDCDTKIIFFGNDSYNTDARSRREVEELTKALSNIGLKNPVLGVTEDGCTWALVCRNYKRKAYDLNQLDNMIRVAWDVACDMTR